MPDMLDLGQIAVQELHLIGCECESCDSEVISIPLERASSEDYARFILHKVENKTGIEDLELKKLAFILVRRARDEAPRTPDRGCTTWESAGHKGHHWFLGTGLLSYVCACGSLYTGEA